jgi:hypothetical protein
MQQNLGFRLPQTFVAPDNCQVRAWSYGLYRSRACNIAAFSWTFHCDFLLCEINEESRRQDIFPLLSENTISVMLVPIVRGAGPCSHETGVPHPLIPPDGDFHWHCISARSANQFVLRELAFPIWALVRGQDEEKFHAVQKCEGCKGKTKEFQRE